LSFGLPQSFSRFFLSLFDFSWKNHGIEKYISVALRQYLKKINKKNIDKGIDTFNKAVQAFGSSMDQITKEIGSSKKEKSNNDKKNLEKLWGKPNDKSSKSNVKIWSDNQNELKSQEMKDRVNIEKIWGKRK